MVALAVAQAAEIEALMKRKDYRMRISAVTLGIDSKDSLEKLFKENLTRYAEQYGDIRIIGSGGNINKLNKLARHSKQDSKNLTLAELKRLHSMMQPLSIEEREISFSLKEDRADVIIPAAEIFLKACEYLKCENIMVPNISLADSIVDGLYEKMMAKTEE